MSDSERWWKEETQEICIQWQAMCECGKMIATACAQTWLCTYFTWQNPLITSAGIKKSNFKEIKTHTWKYLGHIKTVIWYPGFNESFYSCQLWSTTTTPAGPSGIEYLALRFPATITYAYIIWPKVNLAGTEPRISMRGWNKCFMHLMCCKILLIKKEINQLPWPLVPMTSHTGWD